MNQMKISKELFVKTMEKIQNGFRKKHEASDAIEKIIDGYAIISITDDFENALIELLEDVCDDKSETISWWLYETKSEFFPYGVERKIWIQPEHKNNKTGKEIEIDLSTPEKLYDYLCEW